MTLINGQPGDSISVDDRGLQYGDGVFETIAIINGKAPHLSKHISRLSKSCKELLIPNINSDVIIKEVESVADGATKAVVKVIITAGQGERGYKRPDNIKITRIVKQYPWPDYPKSYQQDGIETNLLKFSFPPDSTSLKTLNRLPQVITSSLKEHPEAIVFDSNRKEVMGGTMSNFMIYSDNNLIYCENPIIEGVMQSVVLEAADSLGIEHQSKHIDMDMISTATSMFFCNSLIGIWPIIRYKKNYKIHKYIKELQDIINKYYEY